MLQFWHLHIHRPLERRKFRRNIAFNSFLLYYFYYFRHLYNKIFPFLLYSTKKSHIVYVFNWIIVILLNSMRLSVDLCHFQFIINCELLLNYFWQQSYWRWPFYNRFVWTGELELLLNDYWGYASAARKKCKKCEFDHWTVCFEY